MEPDVVEPGGQPFKALFNTPVSLVKTKERRSSSASNILMGERGDAEDAESTRGNEPPPSPQGPSFADSFGHENVEERQEDDDAAEGAGDEQYSAPRRRLRREKPARRSFMQATSSTEDQEDAPAPPRGEDSQESWENSAEDSGGRTKSPRRGGTGFSALEVEDVKQQGELEDAYANMLYLDDPDDVDKAEQVAWMKMQLEDRKFLKGGAGLHRIRPQRKPKMLLQNRKTRMLNRRRAAGSLSSWDHSEVATPRQPTTTVGGSLNSKAAAAGLLQLAKSAPPAAPSKDLPQAYKDAELADM